MAIPLEYNPLTKVVPSDPDRLPHIPVQVLYLIAQALPQPSQVLNLARVNKATWDYLQPALYECEVTYEARLVAHFGDGIPKRRSAPPTANTSGQNNGDDGAHGATDNDEQPEIRVNCEHGLATGLCETCGQRIAIERKDFKTYLVERNVRQRSEPHSRTHFFKSRGMTALHWACAEGTFALPVARKAIEAAKAHNPSYIDGLGLRARQYGNRIPIRLFGEIPPPLFTATAFGNLKLCVELVEAGCNVNLFQAMHGADSRTFIDAFFRIHDSCVPTELVFPLGRAAAGQWLSSGLIPLTCNTAGHVALDFGHADVLGYLLDNGLDPLMGKEPLIHQAARKCDLPAVRALLQRRPEMARHRWDEVTPLHSLCRSVETGGFKTFSLDDLRSVAEYLIQKGASLEARGDFGLYPSLSLTPLQCALENFAQIESNKASAPIALVKLGADWDVPFISHSVRTVPLLIHCVREAITPPPSNQAEDPWGWRVLVPRRYRYHAMAYANLIKAIVSSTWRSNPDPALAPSSERHMQAFLDAFRELAKTKLEYAVGLRKSKNTFAIEAVGRMLLSTGIRPIQKDMDKWETLIADNEAESRADEGVARQWREVLSDLPSAGPATTQ
ncbi:hypothetical protein KVR01_011650 [Diaporthe batatas]|uniref:uncharacterized protein n=1 Tax=Diaporthe batatas TaxID=748121 RepID=UPI001D054EDA|nr:uncharacterized protein KVR01_011650 [Diaporthe batatas]KAG8158528.1 hypothetical protein KVR01_011650 [Diaporthe batatas]